VVDEAGFGFTAPRYVAKVFRSSAVIALACSRMEPLSMARRREGTVIARSD